MDKMWAIVVNSHDPETHEVDITEVVKVGRHREATENFAKTVANDLFESCETEQEEDSTDTLHLFRDGDEWRVVRREGSNPRTDRVLFAVWVEETEVL